MFLASGRADFREGIKQGGAFEALRPSIPRQDDVVPMNTLGSWMLTTKVEEPLEIRYHAYQVDDVRYHPSRQPSATVSKKVQA